MSAEVHKAEFVVPLAGYGRSENKFAQVEVNVGGDIEIRLTDIALAQTVLDMLGGNVLESLFIEFNRMTT